MGLDVCFLFLFEVPKLHLIDFDKSILPISVSCQLDSSYFCVLTARFFLFVCGTNGDVLLIWTEISVPNDACSMTLARSVRHCFQAGSESASVSDGLG